MSHWNNSFSVLDNSHGFLGREECHVAQRQSSAIDDMNKPTNLILLVLHQRLVDHPVDFNHVNVLESHRIKDARPINNNAPTQVIALGNTEYVPQMQQLQNALILIIHLLEIHTVLAASQQNKALNGLGSLFDTELFGAQKSQDKV